MAVLKFPPPPSMTSPELQQLNRWLIEIQSILNSQGEIDPEVVGGLPDAYTQIGDNSTDITSLFAIATAQSAAINSLSAQVVAMQASVNALSQRAQVFNGVGPPAGGLGAVNDWYANIGPPIGAAGSRIYIKTAVATWTAFPF